MSVILKEEIFIHCLIIIITKDKSDYGEFRLGIIRAAVDAVKGGLADQWLEVIEPQEMGDTTVMSVGVKLRKKDRRNHNRKGTDSTISNGSIIHVGPNQLMLLVDGGRIIDYTAEEGYYEVMNSSMPSIFNGELDEAVKEHLIALSLAVYPHLRKKRFLLIFKKLKGLSLGRSKSD